MPGLKQKVGLKRLKKVASVLGKPVKVGFVNGDLPHGVILAWDTDGDAYFVNMKRKTVRQYVKGKKLLMHKLIDWRSVRAVKKEDVVIDPVTFDLPSREWLLNRYGLDEFQVKQLSGDDIKLLLDEWDADKKAKHNAEIEAEWEIYKQERQQSRQYDDWTDIT